MVNRKKMIRLSNCTDIIEDEMDKQIKKISTKINPMVSDLDDIHYDTINGVTNNVDRIMLKHYRGVYYG